MPLSHCDVSGSCIVVTARALLVYIIPVSATLTHDNSPTLLMWIRKDFMRMYDFCDQWYERVTGSMVSRANKQAPSVVIVGQSGVG